MLEHGVREPFRARWALYGAGDVGRAVEVLEGLDKGVGRASRHADELVGARRLALRDQGMNTHYLSGLIPHHRQVGSDRTHNPYPDPLALL